MASRRLIAPGEPLTEVDVTRTLTIREALRQLIAAERRAEALERDAKRRLEEATTGASFELRFTSAGPQFVPTGTGPLDRALGVLLAIAATAMIDGSWSRLKSCPGHHCGWVFFDLSRNNSGRWCSMTVCGGREKARAHYHRHRARGD
jgi:predicted RNA-binding Zn ribbon-like protein